jgi:hypothetical protein
VFNRTFRIASQIGDSYQEYPAKSVGKQGLKNGASKKLTEFFIRNLLKLLNLATDFKLGYVNW